MATRKPVPAPSAAEPMPRRKVAEDAEPESRKQAILDAAAEIFHRKGYHATSIQDIAEEVGMLKGSLYYYISSKDELLLQIITDVHTAAFAEIQPVLDMESPAIERLRAFIITHATYCAEHQTGMGVYLHEYKAVTGPAKVKVLRMRDRYEQVLREIIEEGQSEGDIRAELDTALTVRSILGMTNWLYHWYSPGGPLIPTQIGESMAALVISGIGAR